MALYADKLPESCKDCEFARYSVSQEMYICNISNLVIPHYNVLNTREKSCPLKELTNAQLAVGWYQEGKKPLNESSRSFRESDTIGYLIDYEWEVKEEPPKYTYTDWKGAREAINLGKKVTHDVLLVLDYFTLTKTEDAVYVITNAEGELGFITDGLYDSKSWRVWN